MLEKTCFQRSFDFCKNFIYKETCGKGSEDNVNFLRKLCVPVITWNKKTFIEASYTINIDTREKVFAVVTFNSMWVASF